MRYHVAWKSKTTGDTGHTLRDWSFAQAMELIETMQKKRGKVCNYWIFPCSNHRVE